MRRDDIEDELTAFFSGQLEGAMGLRSWLGGWIESGFMPSGPSGGVPPEPGALALRAARDTERIEGALEVAGRHHGLVLAFRFVPRPPSARLSSYGELTGVLLAPVLENEVRWIVDDEDEQELRRALRSGTAEAVRAAAELIRPSDTWGCLMALETVHGALRSGAVRRARRTRSRLKALAGRTLAAALDAYAEARVVARRRQSRARIERYSRSLLG